MGLINLNDSGRLVRFRPGLYLVDPDHISAMRVDNFGDDARVTVMFDAELGSKQRSTQNTTLDIAATAATELKVQIDGLVGVGYQRFWVRPAAIATVRTAPITRGTHVRLTLTASAGGHEVRFTVSDDEAEDLVRQITAIASGAFDLAGQRS